jgi:predicted RNase H-like HicB family nuclease
MTKQKFVVIIERDEDGQYIGTVPNIKGCHSYGETIDELLKNIEEAIEANLEALKAENKTIPTSNFSGIQEIEIEVR